LYLRATVFPPSCHSFSLSFLPAVIIFKIVLNKSVFRFCPNSCCPPPPPAYYQIFTVSITFSWSFSWKYFCSPCRSWLSTLYIYSNFRRFFSLPQHLSATEEPACDFEHCCVALHLLLPILWFCIGFLSAVFVATLLLSFFPNSGSIVSASYVVTASMAWLVFVGCFRLGRLVKRRMLTLRGPYFAGPKSVTIHTELPDSRLQYCYMLIG
jgi:hypothetical protein